MEKILITGTGRCGTTFLIKIFSFLDYNTGFNRDNYSDYISYNCNSGMEMEYTSNYYILKNPKFMTEINTILEDRSVKIKTIIIPLRDLKESALSRIKNGNKNGGLWNATNELNQIEYYKEILTNFIYITTKNDINTIYIDFERMVKDKLYLFNKIKSILDEKSIDYIKFCQIYDEVTIISKP
jgi:hypothetical protein